MKIIDRDIRRRQLVSVLIYSLIQCLSLLSPYLMGRIIDDYIPNRRLTAICVGIALFALVPLVSIGVQTAYNYLTIKYVRKKGNEYALRILENLVYKEMAFYDHENSLELLSYTSKEIVGYINFYVADESMLYVNVITSLLLFAVLFGMSPWVALVQLLYIPLAYYPVQVITRNVEKEVQQVMRKNAESSQLKGDIFKGIEIIKLCRLESEKLKEAAKINASINGIWGKIAALDSLSGIWTTGFVSVLFSGLTFGLGAVLVLMGAGGFTLGQLVAALSYCGLLYTNINAVLQAGVARRKKNGEYEKAFSYLNMEGERERDRGKRPYALEKGIRFRNCSFSYDGGEPVLKNVTMDFPVGTWTGIVGASGGGKSTILNILPKLYAVGDGQVFFDDTDIDQMDCFSIRENLVKITQTPFLFPGTVRDNLKLMKPEATEDELREAIAFACLTDYIEGLPKGLDTDIGEAGKMMSGGERQRLSIAMGILRPGKLLLLDEVTSSLNAELEAELAAHFRVLLDRGCTIISVTHREAMNQYADAVYKIENGSAVKIK